MEKEQILKMAKQLKETCEENGIAILMLIGDTKGDKVDSTNLLFGKANTLITMIAGLMNKSTYFSRLIQNAFKYYSEQQKESQYERLSKNIEEFFKELRDARAPRE